MARFALFTNGVKVETLDELKDNFNIKDMLENYRNKALHRWLTLNRMIDKLSALEAIKAKEDADLIDELSKIFEVSSDVIEKQKYRLGFCDLTKIIEKNAIHAANGDCEIGKIITDAMNLVGHDGVILTEESKTEETRIDIVEGMSIDRKYFSPVFINNDESTDRQLEDAYILICENAISNDFYQILPVLQAVSKSGKSLLIIAGDVTDSALEALKNNQERGILNVCAIKISSPCEYHKAILEDIAILFGTTLIYCGFSLDAIGLGKLGQAKRILIDKDSITIVGADTGCHSAIYSRIQLLKEQIEDVTDETVREILQERLNKLARGIAIIKVGAETETMMLEKKERIKEALKATCKAMKNLDYPVGQEATDKQHTKDESSRIQEDQESKSKESKNITGIFGYLFGDQMENLSRQVDESFSWLSRNSQNVPKVQSKQSDTQDRFEKDNSEEGLSDYEKELLTDIDPAEFREYLRNSSLMQLQCIEAILNKHANAGHPVAQWKKELWSEYNDEKLKQL